MEFLVYTYTDKGIIRNKNEDTIFAGGKVCKEGEDNFYCQTPFACGVCDGVGGESSGEIASKMTAEKLSKSDYSSFDNIRSDIEEIHSELRRYGSQNPQSFNLQTTLCMAVIGESGECRCFNTGDSRLYFYHGGKAVQISVDHSYVQTLYEQGKISKEELRLHPDRNIITSSIGMSDEKPLIDEFEVCNDFAENDAVIICSDGVSDFVWELEIEAAMSLEIPFAEKIRALAQLAVERGSSDNISIVAVTMNTKERSDNIEHR